MINDVWLWAISVMFAIVGLLVSIVWPEVRHFVYRHHWEYMGNDDGTHSFYCRRCPRWKELDD